MRKRHLNDNEWNDKKQWRIGIARHRALYSKKRDRLNVAFNA